MSSASSSSAQAAPSAASSSTASSSAPTANPTATGTTSASTAAADAKKAEEAKKKADADAAAKKKADDDAAAKKKADADAAAAAAAAAAAKKKADADAAAAAAAKKKADADAAKKKADADAAAKKPNPNQELADPALYEHLYPNPKSSFSGACSQLDATEIEQSRLTEERNASTLLHNLLGLSEQMRSSASHKTVQAIPDIMSQTQRLLDRANHSLDAPKRGFFVFVGMQSDGKSFVMNLLTLLGINPMDVGLGTKTLVHYRFRRGASPRYAFEGKECAWNELLPKLKESFESEVEVFDRTLSVEVETPWIPFPMDFYDVPGMTDNPQYQLRADRVASILRRLAADPDLTFVWITDATSDPASKSYLVYDILRDLGVEDSRIIRVLNKVNLWLLTPNTPESTGKRLDDWKEFHQKAEFLYRNPPTAAPSAASPDPAATGASPSTEPATTRTPANAHSIPFLVSAVKQDDFDLILDKSPEEQYERWKAAIEEGSRLLSAVSLTGWPKDRVGVPSLSRYLNSRVAGAISNQIGSYLEDLLASQEEDVADDVKRAAAAAAPITTDTISAAVTQYLAGLQQYMQEAAYNKEGTAFIAPGVEVFFEGHQTREHRNKEAEKAYNVRPASRPKNLSLRQDVAHPNYQDDLGDLNLLIGSYVMDKNFYDQVTEILQRYAVLDNDTLFKLRSTFINQGTSAYQPAILRAIKLISAQVHLADHLERLVQLLAISARRIIRLGIFGFNTSKLASISSHFGLFGAIHDHPKFRKIFDGALDEFLDSKMERSKEYLQQMLKERFESFVDFRSPLQVTSLIKTYYGDISDAQFASLDLNKHPIPSEFAPSLTRGTPDGKPSGQDSANDWMRNVALVCYSERACLFVKNLLDHYHLVWRELFQPINIIPLFTDIQERVRKDGLADLAYYVGLHDQNEHLRRDLERMVRPGFEALRAELPGFLEFTSNSPVFGSWQFSA